MPTPTRRPTTTTGSSLALVRQRGPITLGEIDRALVAILGERANRRLIRRLRPHLLEALGAGADEIAELGDVATTIGIGHPVGQAYARGHLPKLSRVNATTRRQIRALIATTIEEGLPRRAQTALLRKEFEFLRVGRRPITIARTESGIAWHTGAQGQLVDSGFPSKSWLTSRDARVRDSHSPMDLQCRGPEEPFTSGKGVSLMHPHDPAAPPAEIVNCRCTLLPNARPCGEPIRLMPHQLDAVWRQFVQKIRPIERRVKAQIIAEWRQQEKELLARLAA